MPRISVMIPAYNVGHLIADTLESAINQTFRDIEIIVVDDASSDNTVEVARQYKQKDSRIQVVCNDVNLGLTRNWNKCLDLARGEFVQIFQSDDLMDADYLARAVDVFEAHPTAGWLAASCRYIDHEGTIIHPGDAVESRLYSAGDEAVLAILQGGWPHVTSIVMRRICYEQHGKYNEELWHGPDVEMDARLAAHSDHYRIGDVCTSFRRHGGNMGDFNFLRKSYLEANMKKKKNAWRYLSDEGLRKLNIDDLEQYLRQDTAHTALGASIAMMAYGEYEISRYYLFQAMKYGKGLWSNGKWWKAMTLNLAPPLGEYIMRRRKHITDIDRQNVKKIKADLQAREKQM